MILSTIWVAMVGAQSQELKYVGSAMDDNAVVVSAEDQPEYVTITDDSFEKADENGIFQVVEEQPQFPGGMAALMEYLKKNVRYPATCKEQGLQGRVIVQFVVNSDGSICDEKLIKSVDPQLDAEALRVIRSMPKWKPGMQKGKPVRVRYTLPVTFRLAQPASSTK